MAGFDNDVVFGTNIDLRGVKPRVGQFQSDGQILIGSTVAPKARIGTLTAGTGISIANGAGSITISSFGTGITWIDVTGTTQTIATLEGYFSDNAGTVTFTLPASSTQGDVFQIVGIQGAWTVEQNANQQIKFGSQSTTIGVTGSISSTNLGDCVSLVALNTSADSVWRVYSSVGNITIV